MSQPLRAAPACRERWTLMRQLGALQGGRVCLPTLGTLKWGRKPHRRYVRGHSFPLLSIRPDRLLIGTSATCQSIPSQDAGSEQAQRSGRESNKLVSRYMTPRRPVVTDGPDAMSVGEGAHPSHQTFALCARSP